MSRVVVKPQDEDRVERFAYDAIDHTVGHERSPFASGILIGVYQMADGQLKAQVAIKDVAPDVETFLADTLRRLANEIASGNPLKLINSKGRGEA